MRNNSYPSFHPSSTKPSILAVIGERIELRRQRKEYVGRCPFHGDTNPSFTVSEDKQVFHCFACQIGGDVYDFVQRFDGIGFAEAKRQLCGGDDTPTPKRQAAEDSRRWALEQRQKLNARLRELDEEIEWADEIPDAALAEHLWNERRLLADFRDDLECPQNFTELKELIQNIIESWT